MATLVLSVVGRVIGGPVGAAIGAVIGQQIDQVIFAPKARQGPRLQELQVQTSSYGTAIPAIFGAMRVAGTVIWASDLIEHRSKSGGGKGRPATVNYSYSVHMAVAVSSRRVERIGRIWADGNLLRGAAGDFKVETGFRFYHGDGDQLPDPLIASAEGSCPAFRGLAYAVFEDFQLADFGNRIPSLTFELFEGDGAVPVLAIAGAVSRGLIGGNCVEAVDGYAVSGADARAALDPLLSAMPVLLRGRGDRLELIDWWSGDAPVPVEPLGASGSTMLDRPMRQLGPAYKAPQSLGIRYYEPARDYQTGVQQKDRSGTARGALQIDLPACLDAAAALRLADLQLMQADRGRDGLSGQFAPTLMPISAGDWIDDGSGAWRVVELEHQRGAMKITATRHLAEDASMTASASPGRNIAAPDLAIGETRLMLVDLPAITGVDPGRAIVAAFAAGTQPGWRRAALSLQQGSNLLDLGSTAARAIMGAATSALPPHNPWLIDQSHHVDVQTWHEGMILPPGAGSPFAADAPLLLLGQEYIRYGQADYLGDGRYRLSHLLRGCIGSEAETAGHLMGDAFLLIEQAAAHMIDDVAVTAGTEISIEALGLGDAEPVLANIVVQARAIRPLPPVHGRADFLPEGSLAISWVRRARVDAGWQDGVDQPLVEEAELYALSICLGDTELLAANISQNTMTVAAAEMAAWDLSTAENLTIRVRQIGRFAISDPLSWPVLIPV